MRIFPEVETLFPGSFIRLFAPTSAFPQEKRLPAENAFPEIRFPHTNLFDLIKRKNHKKL